MPRRKKKNKPVKFYLEYFECSDIEKELVDDHWSIDENGKYKYRLEALALKYRRSASTIQNLAPRKSKFTYESVCDCGQLVTGNIRNRSTHKQLVRNPNKAVPKCLKCQGIDTNTEEPTVEVKEKQVPSKRMPENIMMFVLDNHSEFVLEEDFTLKAGEKHSIHVNKTTDGKMILFFTRM